MSDETLQMIRMSAWSNFIAAQLGFNYHPGTTRDRAERRSRSDIIAEADAYLAAMDARFHVKQD